MKRMAKAKQKYDSIPIPEELSKRVVLEIEKAGKVQVKKTRRRVVMKRFAAAAAVAGVLFTAGVNSSEAFAKGVDGIPMLGAIARVVTFRAYEAETENAGIAIDIPSVEMILEQFNGLEKEVNENIYAFCKEYAKEAMSRAAEYRQAFLETGGTEEEWAEHDVRIKVWYDVKAQTDRYLSLAVMGNDNWNNADYEAKYYNLDLKNGKTVEIDEILENIPLAEESVRDQVIRREKETGMEFWIDEWKGIDKDTKFYINSRENPVIVFDRYEIAPGAAGIQEFEIIKR